MSVHAFDEKCFVKITDMQLFTGKSGTGHSTKSCGIP